ncbi:MBL fold metallo-hydrolase [Kribbella sp. NPDC050241]|uniref:MBL fold metallo-hydrolase n=1 Tax=Kribbella sp. NPDC050241 TaxID=3364115 RepID=UPI0037B8B58C
MLAGLMRLICQQPSPTTSRHPGESWLWQGPGNFRVVVDVGSADDFARGAASFAPNVLILTHDDADHVGAIDSFFEAYRHPPSSAATVVPEVWAPLDWFRVLQALAGLSASPPGSSPAEARHQLSRPVLDQVDDDASVEAIQGLLGLASPLRDHSIRSGASDQVANAYPGADAAESLELDLAEPANLPAKLVADIEQFLNIGPDNLLSDTLPAHPISEPTARRSDERRRVRAAMPPQNRIQQAVEAAISTNREVISKLHHDEPNDAWPDSAAEVADRVAASAVRLALIVLRASYVGCRFRWFDVDRATAEKLPCWPTEGRPGRATIVNAVEVEPGRLPDSTRPDVALYFSVRLSIQNRRALVTYLWPTALSAERIWVRDNQTDGVLIWSDSTGRVAGGPPTAGVVPWRTTSIMSAPHHASKDAGHKAIWRYRPPGVKVILSSNRHRDSPDFLALPLSLRDCTMCGSRRSDTPVGADSYNWPVTEDVELRGGCATDHR